MRFLRDKHGFSLALIVAIVILLPALALMQYKWVGQVSDAEHERLRTSIRNTTERMCQELNRELMQPVSLFRPGSNEEIALRISQWQSSSPWRDMVTNLYLVHLNDEQPEVQQYDWEAKGFKAAQWPERLQRLRVTAVDRVKNPPGPGNPPAAALVDDDAMAMLAPGRERDLCIEILQKQTELLEALVDRIGGR